MVGWLCFSKAGHDKNKIYIIIEETEEYVYLSDGHFRSKEKLKKKNKRHIQYVKKSLDPSLQERIRNGEAYSDEEIKHLIRLYRKAMIQEEIVCQNPM